MEECKSIYFGRPMDVERRSTAGGSTPIDDLPLAMAYVPMQQWKEPFDAEQGMSAGTIFPELVLPFKGWGVTDND